MKCKKKRFPSWQPNEQSDENVITIDAYSYNLRSYIDASSGFVKWPDEQETAGCVWSVWVSLIPKYDYDTAPKYGR